VLTHTARVHAADRTRMFADYPRQRAVRTGERFVPARNGRRCLPWSRPRHVVDGIAPQREHLEGKPAPGTFLEGASALDVEPRQAAAVEEALAEMAAGPARRFRSAVRVDRPGQADALRSHGGEVLSGVVELLGRP
jgi:hypothetical protein